ncbi:hypothetical protein ATCV1_z671R [Acanthocystis turfacea chlorella virus 1]|uniref:Uncharacterized protein z671R n=1 Tax=Chlorovirus heliozoae TaxID=322019 RepID=A7K9T1_9PHYC|nr:hypothetical protein ATCV1_z671R [Acanthocystis turfacea chlorella virus 1]ABT16805.1 hypothetical protein ATCV1_z671R [Acanthocystis turfacea chlorella virus 1]
MHLVSFSRRKSLQQLNFRLELFVLQMHPGQPSYHPELIVLQTRLQQQKTLPVYYFLLTNQLILIQYLVKYNLRLYQWKSNKTLEYSIQRPHLLLHNLSLGYWQLHIHLSPRKMSLGRYCLQMNRLPRNLPLVSHNLQMHLSRLKKLLGH